MLYRLIALVWCFLITASAFPEEEPIEDLFLSTPDQISALSSESSYLIGGLISPLSGQLVLKQTDLVVKGAQNITLNRTYIPPYMPASFPKHKHQQGEHDKKYLQSHLQKNYQGWQFYPHLRLQFNPYSVQVRLSEPNGLTLDFQLSGSNHSIATLAYAPYALSNTAGDDPSGKNDPRNTRISYEDNWNKIIVYATDGSIRIYTKQKTLRINSLLYLLRKEILSNGKILRFQYNAEDQLDLIESLDPKERYVYASLRMTGAPTKLNCHFTSSSGLTVDYNYQTIPVHWEIKEKVKGRKGKPRTRIWAHYPPILSSVSSPYYRHESINYGVRFLMDSYTGKSDIFAVHNASFGAGIPHYRVDQLSLPVGQNDAMSPVYDLNYQPPVAGQKEGTTTVRNSDGTSIIYHFSMNFLTTKIQYFGQNGSLKKEKIFSWGNNHWLHFIEVRDDQNNLLYKKAYEYDHFGNPILEIFSGDLIGNGNLESYTTKRIFSEDGRNLLLKEETEDGKIICFSYLPNTNLTTSKLTQDQDKILLREFSIYDDCNNLIQKIADNGSGENKDDLSNVTQRTLTTYTLRQAAPFLHMPEWIEEKYWEAGNEKPIKKIYLIYDRHGNVASEEVYDAEGTLHYTICKTYNERGDLLTETNRLGQEAVYTYDLRGRPETGLNFSHRLQKILRHDTRGRLRELTEKGDDGIVHVTSSNYDFHDRKIHKKDSSQNDTHYSYDPLVNQISKTEFPIISSIEREAVTVTSQSTYDPFGRELTQTDLNGNTTTYRYNAYGSPVEILHPNGAKETFLYEKNGKLSRHTDLDGLTIHYKSDVLGKVLSKTYVSTDGSNLAQETFTYDGYNLLTESDKEGNITHHSYDGAGRKIRETFCGQITDFSYDSLGRLSTLCKYNGNNTLFIHYRRDLEGRILEEEKMDTSGHTLYKISYSYDKDGNQETITRFINGKEAVETFAYDSLSRLIQYKDAEDHVTTTTYNENYINELGQNVQQKITTDPRAITRIETHDALSRTVRKEILNPHKVTLSCQEWIHDPQGNLLYQKDHVYENNHFKNTQTSKYTYTPDNRTESLTRGFGTKDARTTSYSYFPSGKIATKILPDGVTLAYNYHPLGPMSRIDSSDGQIHHAFEYDLLGHLEYASDENQNIAIQRKVDPFGNVTQEVFPSGLKVKKGYDQFHRLTSLKMDNQGEVQYIYDPLFLRQVIRTSNQGKTLYNHSYVDYDEDGNLVSESLIGSLGQIIHNTNSKGQIASISSPYFYQECQYDPTGNLIQTIIDTQEHLYSYDGLSQLCSENNSIYAHDSLYNRTEKNGKILELNNLNELLTCCSHDLNGNQILKQTPSETLRFTYDPLNRLIEVTSETKKVNFTYDPLGRRLSKTVLTPTALGWKETSRENYLYHGQNEIGAFTPRNEPKNLRIFGLTQEKNSPATIAIEQEGRTFASILDVQGNVRRLIDFETKAIAEHYDFTAFGEQLTSSEAPLNPWRFASKRLDPELGLIYFGKRYYDPEFARWLSLDPAGSIDSANLYQYVFNNPFRYRDPDGQFVFAIPLLTLTWKVIAVAAVTAYVGYELERQHSHSNSALARSFNSAVHQVAQSIGGISQLALNQKLDTEKKQQNTDVYAPDRPLPMDKDGIPIPESDAPHTQLGTGSGRKGPYPQAREFDEDGQPVREIDFTDHGRPHEHTNPHQHRREKNPTGGTPSREKPEPIPGWRY